MKKRVAILGFLILNCFTIIVLAQETNTSDSIISTFSTDEKIATLLNQAEKLIKTDTAQAFNFAKEALILSIEKKDTFSIAKAAYTGALVLKLVNLPKAIAWLLSTEEILHKSKFSDLHKSTTGLLANFYYLANDYENAFYHAQKYTTLFQASKNTADYVNMITLLANIHLANNNSTEALKLYSEAAYLYQQSGATFNYANLLNKMGNSYYQQSDYIKATEYYNSALQALENEQSDSLKNIILLNKAIVNYHVNDFRQANEIILSLTEQFNNPSAVNNYLKLQLYSGLCNYNLSNTKEAIQIFENLVNLAKNNNNLFILNKAYKQLAILYLQNKKTEEAIKTIAQISDLNDLININLKAEQEKISAFRNAVEQNLLASNNLLAQNTQNNNSVSSSFFQNNYTFLVIAGLLLLIVLAFIFLIIKYLGQQNVIKSDKNQIAQLADKHRQLIALNEEVMNNTSNIENYENQIAKYTNDNSIITSKYNQLQNEIDQTNEKLLHKSKELAESAQLINSYTVSQKQLKTELIQSNQKVSEYKKLIELKENELLKLEEKLKSEKLDEPISPIVPDTTDKNQHFFDYLNTLNNPVIMLDSDIQAIFVNTCFTENYGYNLNDISTTEKGNVITSLYGNEALLLFNKVLQTSNPENCTHTAAARSGYALSVKSVFTPMLNNNNTIEKVIITDTLLKETEEFEKTIENYKHQITDLENLHQKKIHDISEQNKQQITEINERIKQTQTPVTTNTSFSNDTVYYQKLLTPNLVDLEYYFKTFLIQIPKEQASGDFYWFKNFERLDKLFTYIALGDCTGHGTAGAFLSVFCINLLNQITVYQKISDPAHIMEELDKQFKLVFKNLDPEKIESVQISIVRIDREKNSFNVLFAGASQSMVIYSNTKNDFKIIEGDFRTIGGFSGITKPEKFNSHWIQCQVNDLLYFYTDGFTNQLNTEHKKLGLQNGLNWLRKMVKEPVKMQQTLLMQQFNSWQNNTFQPDDISIMGIRL